MLESIQELTNIIQPANFSSAASPLGTHEVHVWRVSLEQPSGVLRDLRATLSADELAKSARFHFENDRRRYVVARSGLRLILGRYLALQPESIRFQYADNGKPSLTADVTPPLFFNLAHSGELAIYAFTRIGEIGVDVELIQSDFTGDEIATRFFSASEVDRLQQVQATERHRAFFDCWTRKEAFIKATGIGLSLPLDQFDVTLTPGEPAALLRTQWDENEARKWSLRALDLGQHYAGAVALRAHGWEVASDLELTF